MRPLIEQAIRRAAGAIAERAREAANDPAPSRWAYKAQRLWLTPLFRQTLKIGIPAYAAVFAFGLAVQDGAPGQAVAGAVTGMWDGLKSRPEFAVSELAVAGASPRTEGLVRAALADALPVSTFDLDIPSLEARLSDLGAVADARFALGAGGVLSVELAERPAALLWRSDYALTVLDADGIGIGPAARRGDHPDLPLVVGDGADAGAATALAVMAAAGPVAPRIRGLVRMGERRWDVVLTGDLRILLPEQGASEAMRRVAAMHRAEALLDRGVTHVDMRLAARPTVRLSRAAKRERDEMIELARDGG